MNISQNILAKYHGFVNERTTIKTTLMCSCHWKALVHFCLRKKRHGNALWTLTVNYHKIVQKNTSWHSKQQQVGNLMICDVIWSLLFDWKIGVFQQTVVRVYCILKEKISFWYYHVTFPYLFRYSLIYSLPLFPYPLIYSHVKIGYINFWYFSYHLSLNTLDRGERLK